MPQPKRVKVIFASSLTKLEKELNEFLGLKYVGEVFDIKYSVQAPNAPGNDTPNVTNPIKTSALIIYLPIIENPAY